MCVWLSVQFSMDLCSYARSCSCFVFPAIFNVYVLVMQFFASRFRHCLHSDTSIAVEIEFKYFCQTDDDDIFLLIFCCCSDFCILCCVLCCYWSNWLVSAWHAMVVNGCDINTIIDRIYGFRLRIIFCIIPVVGRSMDLFFFLVICSEFPCHRVTLMLRHRKLITRRTFNIEMNK